MFSCVTLLFRGNGSVQASGWSTAGKLSFTLGPSDGKAQADLRGQAVSTGVVQEELDGGLYVLDKMWRLCIKRY